MRKIFFLFLMFQFVFSIDSTACTTAVISGKYTKNGRPMIWKNRDTWAINNHVKHFTGFKYEFMGLVNSKDSLGKSVWIGVNKVGFAIMNSASYNLNLGSNEKLTGLEGQVIKDALANCKTLADFEALLNSYPKPSGLEANFGVIDADGGAAYYEFNHDGYMKFDANDPKVAPFGYIIRANYSHTGKLGVGSGYIRYNTANELFYQQQSTNGLTPQFIEQNVAKSLNHFLTKENLFQKYGNLNPDTPQYAHFLDFIPRTGSSSSVVVEGVKAGENPELSSMWSDVGFPLASIIVPTFFSDNNTALPYITTYKPELKDAPICYAALKLKNEDILNIRWGEKDNHYINVNALANNEGSGIRQILKRYENEIYKKANAMNAKFQAAGKTDAKEVKEFYNWMDTYVKEVYKKEFDIQL
jgi:hypothetical protein